MEQLEFQVKGDYIELNKVLKLLNLVASGGEANQVIAEGYVIVNNQVDLRKRRKCIPGDHIVFDDAEIRLI